MAKRALLNVDYTIDFVAEDGKLTCGVPGQEIEDKVVSVTQEFIDAGDYVVFAIDAHEAGTNPIPDGVHPPPHAHLSQKQHNLPHQ